MAVGDFYKLQLRYDYGSVAMRNTLFYEQIKESGDARNGATLLADIAGLIGVQPGEGIRPFFRQFQNDQCLLSCIIASTERAVSPSSVAEYQVNFSTGNVGINPGNGLAPGVTMVHYVTAIGADQGKKPPYSLIYTGGLAELFTAGVNFTSQVGLLTSLAAPHLITPRWQNEPDPQFRLLIRSGNQAQGFRYTQAAYVNPPCYPSVRRSRKPNPC